MKTQINIMLFSSLLLFQSIGFAATKTLVCRNEAWSTVTASLSLNESNMKVKFGAGSDGGRLENDFKNKSVNLKIDESASSNGYVEYQGKVLVDSAFQDYRSLTVRILSSLLNNTAEFHVTFGMSETHGKESDPSVFSSYGMLCKPK